MKLMELEQQLGISFPKKFHEIYETGAYEVARNEQRTNSKEPE